jgi:hypothetical protein
MVSPFRYVKGYLSLQEKTPSDKWKPICNPGALLSLCGGARKPQAAPSQEEANPHCRFSHEAGNRKDNQKENPAC